MTDDSLAVSYVSDLDVLALSEQLPPSAVLQLKSLLLQKSPAIMNAFETFSWSRNEKALLAQLASLAPSGIEEPKPGKSLRRPPSITVPYNREYSYYSTMETQFSVKEDSGGCLGMMRMGKRVAMGIGQGEAIEEGEDLDCSFSSELSSEEENRNSLSRKMAYLKSLKLNAVVIEKEMEENSTSCPKYSEDGLEERPEEHDCL